MAVVLYYTVLGPEEGRDIQLAFSDFPTRIFTMVTVTSDVSSFKKNMYLYCPIAKGM